jgi:hypothetical protein
LVFKHLIELESCECVFCSAMDADSGRTKIYLVFKELERIYMRNARRGTWDELKDEEECQTVRCGFEKAVMERKIPCFRAAADDTYL